MSEAFCEDSFWFIGPVRASPLVCYFDCFQKCETILILIFAFISNYQSSFVRARKKSPRRSGGGAGGREQSAWVVLINGLEKKQIDDSMLRWEN